MRRKVQDKGYKLVEKAVKESKDSKAFRRSLAGATSVEEIESVAKAYGVAAKSATSLAARACRAGLDAPANALLENKHRVDLASWVETSVEGRASLSEVEAGVGHLVREAVANDAEVRAHILQLAEKPSSRLRLEAAKAKETAAALKKQEEAQTNPANYDSYLEFSCPVNTVPSHAVLAVNRGEKEGVLTVKVSASVQFDESVISFCRKKFLLKGDQVEKRTRIIETAIQEGYKKNRE